MEIPCTEERKPTEGGVLAAFVVGAIVGSVAALLLAPRKGAETRAALKHAFDVGKERMAKVPGAREAFSEVLR
jgi:gas vesicle protein